MATINPKIILFLLISSKFCTASFSKEMDEALNKILQNYTAYDAKTPPRSNASSPIKVLVNFYIRGIESIDEMKMELKLQLTLRQKWNDPRLIFASEESGETTPIVCAGGILEQIWSPDLFFANEKQAQFHSIMKPNIMVMIYPNGDVMYSARVSLTLACPMDLRFYPMDKQACHIIIASYAWPTSYLVLDWKQTVPIEMNRDLTVSNFKLKDMRLRNSYVNATVGVFSCLKATFVFEREFSYYLMQIYIPCAMIVIISWVSFWLGENSIDARVSLGITTILTMVTQIFGINQTAPPVSYIKALDLWTGCSLFFVVMTVLEVSIVSSLKRRKQCGQFAAEFYPRNGTYIFGQSGSQIDLISRIIFPASFLLFNIAYWCAYLLTEQPVQGSSLYCIEHLSLDDGRGVNIFIKD